MGQWFGITMHGNNREVSTLIVILVFLMVKNKINRENTKSGKHQIFMVFFVFS